MLRLDHFVVHVDNEQQALDELKKNLAPLGFPLDLTKGKSTQGFKISNLWVGRQYFEIVRLLQHAASGWPRHWVDRYNRGVRGIYCLFIATRELDNLKEEFKQKGLDVHEPLKKASRDLLATVSEILGLSAKKTVASRSIYLPPVPGTDLELGFIEYDPVTETNLKEHMVPNAEEYGITGINRAKLYLPEWNEGIDYLCRVFPQLSESRGQQKIKLVESELLFFRSDPEDGLHVKLEAPCINKEYTGGKFSIRNVEVKTVPSNDS